MSGFKQETESGVKSGFSGIGKVVAGLGIGLVIGKAFKAGFDEMGEGQKVAAQTAAVIKSTGGAANVSAAQVSNLANAMLKKTGIDDEATQVAENMLLTFTNVRNEVGKNNDIFTQSSKAVLDMDEAMTHGNSTAESLRGTSILVGKALNDPVKGMTALRRVGVSLDEQQIATVKSLVAQGKTMQAQKLILGELTKEFGGSAAAIGNTLPGKLNILRETFRNDMASMLQAAVPTMTKIIGFAGVAMPIAFHAMGTVIHAVADTVRGAFSALKPALQPIIDEIQGLIGMGRQFGSEGVFLRLQDDFKNLSAPAKIAAAAIAGVGAAILLMTAPITSLVALGVGLDVLYHKNQAFHDFVVQAWADIRSTVLAVVSYLQALWAQYGEAITMDARAVYAALAQIVSTGLDWIRGFWQRNGAQITQYAHTALEDVKAIVRVALDLIRGYWNHFGAATIAVVKAEWAMIRGQIQADIQIVKNIIKLALDLIHGNWSAAWHDLVGIVQGAMHLIEATLRGEVTIVLTIAKAIGKAILSGILASLLFIGVQVVRALQGIGDALMGAARAAYSMALHIGKEIVHGVVSGLENLPGDVAHAVYGGVKGGLGQAAGWLGISSPSKYARDKLGVPIAQGVIEGFMAGIEGLKPAITKAVGGAVTGAASAAKGAPSSVAAIIQAASRYGVDPAAMIAIAMHESGLRANAVGDNGSSFGLFQLHQGGALGGMSPKAALDALTNALVAAKALAGLGGRGLTGSAAVSLLSRGFERPADPAGEIADAMSHYKQALSYIGSTAAAVVRGVTAAVSPMVPVGQLTGNPRLPSNAALPGIGQRIGQLAAEAAKTHNIGEGAEDALRQERDLMDVAYQILQRNLATAKGAARARIEAAMETIHRKIGTLNDMIADAVIVTGDALLPDKLRSQLAALQSRFKAQTDLATVLTGDTLAAYQKALEGNLEDQRAVLTREVDALKARLVAAKGRQRAAIQAELGKVRGELSAVADQVLQALEGLVQAAQGRVSDIFATIKSKMDAQFDAATQKMLAALGQQFFQGSLTPAEQALQTYQLAKTQKALQDALTQAQSDLGSALANTPGDAAAIAAARASLAAAEDAIRADKLQTAATESRTAADKAYAAASAKLQADRAALEQQMNDQLDALVASVLNGTGSISDLNDIAKKYGVSISTESIPEMQKLAAATRTLAAEFKKLEALIRRLTGSTAGGAAPGGSKGMGSVDPIIKNAIRNSFGAPDSWMANIPGLASGGRVPYRPGGTVFRIAEGGEDEIVTPASRAAAAGARGVKSIVGALAPLTVLDAIKRTNEAMLDELRRQTEHLMAVGPTPAVAVDPNLAAARARR